jgi:hypothetical protein
VSGVGRDGRAAAAAAAAALCAGQLPARGYVLCTESPLLVLHLPVGAVPDTLLGASPASVLGVGGGETWSGSWACTSGSKSHQDPRCLSTVQRKPSHARSPGKEMTYRAA